MIKIFSPTDKVFNSNGDAVVNATRAVIHKDIHTLHDLGEKVEAKAKAHDQQEQAGMAQEKVTCEQAHAEASLFFRRAFQLAHISATRGILSWSARCIP